MATDDAVDSQPAVRSAAPAAEGATIKPGHVLLSSVMEALTLLYQEGLSTRGAKARGILKEAADLYYRTAVDV